MNDSNVLQFLNRLMNLYVHDIATCFEVYEGCSKSNRIQQILLHKELSHFGKILLSVPRYKSIR